MMLRDYQQRAIDMLYEWFEAGNDGNPCLVLPTGSGKSHIIAALCKDVLRRWPDTTVLMLTHVKELIEQNAEKMRQYWPGAPMGIYSAGIGKKQLGEPITFAGIQSVRNMADQLGSVDIVIIDECHLVSHKDEGGYRKLLKDLQAINQNLRVIGLTATPYRLGHGLITDKPALFDALIEPASIEYLVLNGHLSILRSKVTRTKLDVADVHKRGGEYIESELQAAVDTDDQNQSVVREIITMAGCRKAWLLFCAGVDHAKHVAENLRQQGISAECVTGETPKIERERILTEFKAGRIRAITNANVLTTGFDYPDIDLIAMLRPTMSAGLYVQMAGRGMRLKSHTDHCLVLDFAGVVEMHGPIINVQPQKNCGDGEGEAPTKTCEHCGEMVHISAMKCPSCGTPFPEPVKKPMTLRNDDIMGMSQQSMDVSGWSWRRHVSKASGIAMLAVQYYGSLSEAPVTEYLPVMHDGYAGQKARNLLLGVAINAGVSVSDINERTLTDVADSLSGALPPKTVEYRKDGKFFRVMARLWQ